MFKYNILSDLKDGTCVIPLRKEDTFIICKTEYDEEIKKVLSDFDFTKKVEERGFVLAEETVEKMEEDLRDIVIPEPIYEMNIAREVFEEVVVNNNPIIRKNIKVSVERQVIRGKK